MLAFIVLEEPRINAMGCCSVRKSLIISNLLRLFKLFKRGRKKRRGVEKNGFMS